MRVKKWILLGACAAVAACAETASTDDAELALRAASPDTGLAGTFDRGEHHYVFSAAPAEGNLRIATVSVDGRLFASVTIDDATFDMTLGGASIRAATEGSEADLAALRAFAASEDGAALRDLSLELDAIGGERPELTPWTDMVSMLSKGMGVGTDPALSWCIFCVGDGHGGMYCMTCFGS